MTQHRLTWERLPVVALGLLASMPAILIERREQ